jgi:hypothetical protein
VGHVVYTGGNKKLIPKFGCKMLQEKDSSEEENTRDVL